MFGSPQPTRFACWVSRFFLCFLLAVQGLHDLGHAQCMAARSECGAGEATLCRLGETFAAPGTPIGESDTPHADEGCFLCHVAAVAPACSDNRGASFYAASTPLPAAQGAIHREEAGWQIRGPPATVRPAFSF
ncbi:hypothetical protein [Acanthopleuribacter pedis]|uniref:DUF2946 domain-containing protein n=1 Tax=Acanthopleuribacter pedis TaxID=442870 RepID=A0A8J7PZA7_9BACT|nr:hypothetical protein [Acanthopleuribacter pedis]MBO1317467.1 hypothetical protein [Acanthopleuribacter pedis]